MDQSAQPQLLYEYAGFWRRFLGDVIDSLIVSLVGGIGSGVLGQMFPDANVMISLVILILQYAFYVYFIGSRGQTPGRMVMKIKVVNAVTGNPPSYGKALLRETIGKMLSSLVLSLGYLWMLWDSKKQTWHDKMAGTIVVKI